MLRTLSSRTCSALQQQVRNVTRVPDQKIIMLKDHPKWGFVANDIVTVRRGHMRNYLYPLKYATYATKENIEKLEKSLTVADKRLLEERKRGERVRILSGRSKPTIVVVPLTPPIDKKQAHTVLRKPLKPAEIAKTLSNTFGVSIAERDLISMNDGPVGDIQQAGDYMFEFKTNKLDATAKHLVQIPRKEPVIDTRKEVVITRDLDLDINEMNDEDFRSDTKREDFDEYLKVERDLARSRAKHEKLTKLREEKQLRQKARKIAMEVANEGEIEVSAPAIDFEKQMENAIKKAKKKTTTENVKERKPRKVAVQGAGLKLKDKYAQEASSDK